MSENEALIVMWVIVGVAAIVVEMMTLALIALYVSLGAVAAAVAAAAGWSLTMQVVVFIATSLVFLALTRPLLMRRVQKPITESNVHALTGRTGVVTIEIDNLRSTGQIRVGTEFWTARAAADDRPPIMVESTVVVRDVQGVTALVEPRTLPDHDTAAPPSTVTGPIVDA